MAIKPHNDCTLDEYTPYTDWKLPLSFVKKRHTETIEGAKVAAHTWRMKERVRYIALRFFLIESELHSLYDFCLCR